MTPYFNPKPQCIRFVSLPYLCGAQFAHFYPIWDFTFTLVLQQFLWLCCFFFFQCKASPPPVLRRQHHYFLAFHWQQENFGTKRTLTSKKSYIMEWTTLRNVSNLMNECFSNLFWCTESREKWTSSRKSQRNTEKNPKHNVIPLIGENNHGQTIKGNWSMENRSLVFSHPLFILPFSSPSIDIRHTQNEHSKNTHFRFWSRSSFYMQ